MSDEKIKSRIHSLFLHIKMEIAISYKEEKIMSKTDVPRGFWFIENEEKKFKDILELYPDVKDYLQEKIVT